MRFGLALEQAQRLFFGTQGGNGISGDLEHQQRGRARQCSGGDGRTENLETDLVHAKALLGSAVTRVVPVSGQPAELGKHFIEFVVPLIALGFGVERFFGHQGGEQKGVHDVVLALTRHAFGKGDQAACDDCGCSALITSGCIRRIAAHQTRWGIASSCKGGQLRGAVSQFTGSEVIKVIGGAHRGFLFHFISPLIHASRWTGARLTK
ncbi:cellulose acetylase [Pseudomonas syringae pv. spinaceae]|uniref:Cellulose acetylase n=1 Tax=Pseudomonas syringae pv. spinaceae TaxID=264459 RepID=A0A0Q0D351_PSESX|nr:cellulose acetylase [Pseudomonas syringae pv. spinaceae]